MHTSPRIYLTCSFEAQFDGPPFWLVFGNQLKLQWRFRWHCRSREIPALPATNRKANNLRYIYITNTVTVVWMATFCLNTVLAPLSPGAERTVPLQHPYCCGKQESTRLQGGRERERAPYCGQRSEPRLSLTLQQQKGEQEEAQHASYGKAVSSVVINNWWIQ